MESKSFFKSLIVLFALLFLTGCSPESGLVDIPDEIESIFLKSGTYEGEYWPTSAWKSCNPEDIGFNNTEFEKVYDYVVNSGVTTRGVIVIKDGYIVGETYFSGLNADSKHDSYSVAKSFTSSLVGIALDKGLITSIDNKIYEYFPQWQTMLTPDINKRISIKHLLTMTSGIEWSESGISNNDVLNMATTTDHVNYVLNKPVEFEPGTEWEYSSGSAMLLSGLLESVSGKSAYDFAFENLLQPIGMEDMIWFNDDAGHTITAWGIQATARDYAKFGHLYLNEGTWDEQQIISKEWINESTAFSGTGVERYGYQWRLLNGYSAFSNYSIPENSYAASGLFHQRIYVMPDVNVVAVWVGFDVLSSFGTKDFEFLDMIVKALR